MVALGAGYENSYQQRLRQLSTNRDQATATNDYARHVSQQRGDRSVSDLTDKYQQARQTLPNQFLSRGMMNSGAYQHAVSQYAVNRQRDFSRQYEDNANDLRGYDLNAASIQNQALSGTLDLEAERQARIADLAAQLQAAKPFTA